MNRARRILHVASGDLWAGAEVQAFTLLLHLRRLPDTEVAAVLMNAGMLADKLRSVGVSIYVLDEQKTVSFELVIRLREVLRTWRPDVIHTHRQKENILASLANRSCHNVTSVRTVHGAGEHWGAPGLRGARQRVLSGLDRWCGRALQQRVIAVTRELGERLTRDFPAERIVVIENGVDFEALDQQRGAAEFRLAEPDATHIGIAGRLAAVKRVDIFLASASLLRQNGSGRKWRFHVFGDGPLRPDLEAQAHRLRLGNSVTFHGHRDDIATCLAGLDAVVMCSDHEGMPMVALEAAALGVPTVAHAVGGLLEVVPSEFHVTRHEAQGYKDGVERALYADGRSIAERHAKAIRSRFSAQHNAKRVRELYEQVLVERQRENASHR
jgi:glycosyltransferase involved in cell wall biosynthesis